ncbi:MAG TPA: NUDIX domain-containing protein [Planctomycetota bacterium]|nr:NUDIX domain-containing protein [Planctomycetota bacterium]
MLSIRNSAKAIIIQDGKLLTIRCVSWKDETYYLLPGGGQEHGEALDAALRRECREEVGVDVEVGALRFVRDYIGKNHEFAEKHATVHQLEFLFECRITGGTLQVGTQPDTDQNGIEWLPLADLSGLFPKVLREVLPRLPQAGAVYLGDVN